MSKLSTLCGKSKIYTIEGIEIELKSGFLNIDDLPSLMILADIEKEISIEEKEKRGRIISDMIFKVLKLAIPDASDEEIKEFGLRNIKPLMEAIVEASGLSQIKE